MNQKNSHLLLVGVGAEMVSHFEHLLAPVQAIAIPFNHRSAEVSLQQNPQTILMSGEDNARACELGKAFREKYPKAMLFFGTTGSIFDRDAL